MSSPRLKSLENCVAAAGSAFGFDEGDFDHTYVAPVHTGRIAALFLAIGGGGFAVAHHFGWTTLVASLGGWKGAA